jgi:hypothetical protein
VIHTLLLTADDPAACTCEDVHASEDGSHGTSHHSVEPELVIQLLAWQRGTAPCKAGQKSHVSDQAFACPGNVLMLQLQHNR